MSRCVFLLCCEFVLLFGCCFFLFVVCCSRVSVGGMRISGGLDLRRVCEMYALSLGDMCVRYTLLSYGFQSKNCGLGRLRYVYAIRSMRGRSLECLVV